MAAAGWNAAASKTKEKAATKKPAYPGAPVVVEKAGPELPIDIEEDGGLLKFLQLQVCDGSSVTGQLEPCQLRLTYVCFQTVAALEARRFEDTLEFVTEVAKQGLQPSRDMRNTVRCTLVDAQCEAARKWLRPSTKPKPPKPTQNQPPVAASDFHCIQDHCRSLARCVASAGSNQC